MPKKIAKFITLNIIIIFCIIGFIIIFFFKKEQMEMYAIFLDKMIPYITPVLLGVAGKGITSTFIKKE